MENRIGTLNENALIEKNYAGSYPTQMPIYLIVDWHDGTIDVSTRNYQIDGTPVRQWNGFEDAFRLPDNVDASKLAANIDDYYMETLDRIRYGWSRYYDGNNYKGKLSETALELLAEFERAIETVEGSFSVLNDEKFTDYLLDAGVIDEDGN
jgi:hypothetical protein